MKRAILAVTAACLLAGPPAAFPQPPNREQQIIESLRPRCADQYLAALNSITGSNTPDGRVSIGRQLDEYTRGLIGRDAELLAQRSIPELTRLAASDPPRAPQYRYHQCMAIMRLRQLATGGPGVIQPSYDDPYKTGESTKAFLLDDLMRSCRAEYDAARRDGTSYATLDGAYRSVVQLYEENVRRLLQGGSSRFAYGRFSTCVDYARLQQILQLRSGALVPPNYAHLPVGPLIPGADPPPASRPPAVVSNPPVPAPAAPGAKAGVQRSGRSETTWVTVVPRDWEERRLTLPPAYAHLKPTNAMINHFPDGSVNIWIGKDKESARRVEDRYLGSRNFHNDPATWTSCWDTPEEMQVAWFAYILVAHQLPPAWTIGQGQFTEVFICGGATLEETLSHGYDAAKEHAKGKPFMTYLIHAGLTAEIDYEPIRQRGPFPNGMRPAAMAPWSFWCMFPAYVEEAQGSFTPIDPGSGPAFARYLTTLPTMRKYTYTYPNMDRSRPFTQTSQFGCLRDQMTPEPNQPGPVLIRR